MIVQWARSIVTGGVPEFQTTPWAIGSHLAAELCTVLMLLVGGIAALRSKIWGQQILLVGLGMVIYSEIVSPVILLNKADGQWLLYSPSCSSARFTWSCFC